MTAPNRPYPEGAYGKRGTMRGYQDIDEAEAMRRMRKPIDDANNTAHGRLFGGLFGGFTGFGQLLDDLAKAFRGDGIFGPGPLKDIRDGQLDYASRVDLLEGVRGYGAAYMTSNPAVVAGATRMPFNAQLGPLKGVQVLAAGGLRLESEGLWQISATTLAKSTPFGGGDETVMYLSVREPGGGVIFSEIPDVKRPGGSRLTHHVTAPFVIPEPNFEVHVWVTSAKWRNFAGGTWYSRLSAIKHDNRVVATGTPDYPDDPIN
ncbi:hypothetical protein [Rhodococcus sp. KB6]|uniref:hypothetical protein n=1 Tax=Rhodococcus sp. KB6 TaxID=1752066 RepID=UPI0007181A8A|nr:hypothetical protein [Rhodococcus sp. KB6]